MLWQQVTAFSPELLRQVMERGVLEVTRSRKIVGLKGLVQQNLVMTSCQVQNPWWQNGFH